MDAAARMPDGQRLASRKKLMLTAGLEAVAADSLWPMARLIADPFIVLTRDCEDNFAEWSIKRYSIVTNYVEVE